MTIGEVAEYLMRRGVRKRQAVRVTMALAQWSIASERVGHFASVSEFSRWSGESLRTIDRRRAVIRAAVPEETFRELVAALVEGRRAEEGGREARRQGGSRPALG